MVHDTHMQQSRRLSVVAVLILTFAPAFADDGHDGLPVRFVRGDVNVDGEIDLSDVVSMLGCQFVGGPCPACADSGDTNDDGTFDLSDPIYLLGWLFLGTSLPPFPSPSAVAFQRADCGLDPTSDSLDCDSFPPCVPSAVVTVTTSKRLYLEDDQVEAEIHIETRDAFLGTLEVEASGRAGVLFTDSVPVSLEAEDWTSVPVAFPGDLPGTYFLRAALENGGPEPAAADLGRFGVRAAGLPASLPDTIVNAEIATIDAGLILAQLQTCAETGDPATIEVGSQTFVVQAQAISDVVPGEELPPELASMAHYSGELVDEAGKPVEDSLAVFSIDEPSGSLQALVNSPTDGGQSSCVVEPLRLHDPEAPESSVVIHFHEDGLPPPETGPDNHGDPVTEDVLVSVDFETLPEGVVPTDDLQLPKKGIYFTERTGVFVAFDVEAPPIEIDSGGTIEDRSNVDADTPHDHDLTDEGEGGRFTFRHDNADAAFVAAFFGDLPTAVSGQVWDLDNGDQVRVSAFDEAMEPLGSLDSPVGLPDDDPETLDGRPWNWRLDGFERPIVFVRISRLQDGDGLLNFDNLVAANPADEAPAKPASPLPDAGGAGGGKIFDYIVQIHFYEHEVDATRTRARWTLLQQWWQLIAREFRDGIQPQEGNLDIRVSLSGLRIFGPRALPAEGYEGNCGHVLDHFRATELGVAQTRDGTLHTLFTTLGRKPDGSPDCGGVARTGSGSSTRWHSITRDTSSANWNLVILAQELGHNLDYHPAWKIEGGTPPFNVTYRDVHDPHLEPVSEQWLDSGRPRCTIMRGSYGTPQCTDTTTLRYRRVLPASPSPAERSANIANRALNHLASGIAHNFMGTPR